MWSTGIDPYGYGSSDTSRIVIKPVAFVSSGKLLNEKKPEDEHVSSDEEEKEKNEEKIDETEQKESTDESKKTKKRKGYEIIYSDKKGETKRRKSAFAAEPGKVKRDKGFAAFLDKKVGKNVLNMMLNMGWEFNKGLGKNKEGILNPVRVTQTERGKGQIISDTLLAQKETEETEEETAEYMPSTQRSWRKTAKRKKIVYKTAQDLIKADEEAEKKKMVTEIIDMTGPEARVTSVDKLRSVPETALSRVLPELQFNINELVKISEGTIREIDKRTKIEKEKIVHVRKEKERIQQTVNIEKQRLDSLREVLDVIQKCKAKMKDRENPFTLDTLRELFEVLQYKFKEVYDLYDIAKCAIAMAAPLIREEFKDWNPLQNPNYKKKIIKSWKKLLTSNPKRTDYEALCEDILLPKIRKALVNDWNPINAEPAVLLVENWIKILPQTMSDYILNNIVLPKLQQAVDEWNPRQQLVHPWIHPWLHLLGDQMELHGIYAMIRQKLSTVLTEWTPSDPSAFEIIKVWKDAFEEKDMAKFIVQNILPKLAYTLRYEFEVNPQSQDIKPLQWALTWIDLIPLNQLINMLEKEVFTKWHLVLYNWLKNNPDYEEIFVWYNGWKSLFPEKILEHPNIKKQFKRGLDMIYQASSDQPVKIPTEEEEEERVIRAVPKKKIQIPERQLTFREAVERYAAENDIEFVPKGQQIDGNQIYSFAGVPTYIKNDCLYAQEDGVFKPVSLKELLEKAR